MEEEKYEKQQRIYKIIMLIFLVAFMTFMVTSISLYTYYSKNNIKGYDVEISTTDTDERFSRIRSIIDRYYLWKDEINEKDLNDAAVSGYIAGLGDKYTQYIPKKDMAKFEESVTGTFVGIGVYMQAEIEKGVVIKELVKDSPAEKAGLLAGDIIKKVDGVEYGYDDFNVISDYIKGKEGTKVVITVERDGKQLDFEILRETIKVQETVNEKVLDGNIGYIQITSFDSKTGSNFKENVEKLIEDGAASLIIDLRSNGGGIVDEATEIADYLLDKDQIIMTTHDNKDNKEITKSTSDKLFDLPVVLLVDKGTASASEILIGALKDNGRAKVVGTNTYGKGVIQTVITLSDGSALKITTAEYYTPNGTAIHGVGIKPDIEVEASKKSDDEDAQLNRAIEELKK